MGGCTWEDEAIWEDATKSCVGGCIPMRISPMGGCIPMSGLGLWENERMKPMEGCTKGRTQL